MASSSASQSAYGVDAHAGVPTTTSKTTMQHGQKYNFSQLPQDRSQPVTLECQCKRVQIKVPHRPEEVNPCPCSICWRYGVLWCYYDHGTIRLSVDGKGIGNDQYPDNPSWPDSVPGILNYTWRDKAIQYGHCAHCGVTLYWKLTQYGHETEKVEAQRKTAVNWRLAGPRALEGVSIRAHPTDDGEEDR